MTRVAFFGPSAYGLPPSAFAGIECHAPARRGDLGGAATSRATAILLIDGVFGEAPTVSHKEILGLIARGVLVGGAASLGAIRAAECAPFGMKGIGGIYEEYASGRRTGDADVMLCHAPAALGHAPTSLPLVDFEATLRGLPPNILSLAESTALLVRARALHFSERTWELAADALPPLRRGQAVSALKRHRVFRKRIDAALGLDWLRNV